MRLSRNRTGIALMLALSLALGAFAQSSRSTQQRSSSAPEKKAQTKETPPQATPAKKAAPPAAAAKDAETTDASESADDAQDGAEVVKVETNLVTVPVIASDESDVYVSDLRREEFSIYEDGVKQELAFFATVSAPINVVLMLDTSASTQEKLSRIQSAAVSFVEQLQPTDRVKVISFDEQVRDLSEFTSDRGVLSAAINRTVAGRGTRLYDAMRLALAALRRVEKRKAIVIFTDGVDWHSDETRYQDNIRELEESGVIVYPIRYDTRVETERLARQQAEGGGKVDLATIFGGTSGRGATPPAVPGGKSGADGTITVARNRSPRGSTATTIPGGTIPSGGGQSGGGLPFPPVIVAPQRRERDDPRQGRNDDPRDDPTNIGRRKSPTGGNPWPDDAGVNSSRKGNGDLVSVMLDEAYRTADDYLKELALKSGGELYRADSITSLPIVFEQIAAELRTQYSLGYYPSNRARDGKFRKVQVRTTRKDISVRARPGYRAPREDKGR